MCMIRLHLHMGAVALMGPASLLPACCCCCCCPLPALAPGAVGADGVVGVDAGVALLEPSDGKRK